MTCFRGVLTVFVLAVSGHAQSVSRPEADNSILAELKSFELSPGYRVNLFADEHDGIANPVCMNWDPAGRLWVLCTLAYPQAKPLDHSNDRLLILEDTSGDGRADQTIVFADGLDMPTGFALGDGGAYIGEGNDLIHVKDTDGDDKADTHRVVLTGFGTGDTHQNINSFTWSPGGELLFCQGLHAFSRVETPWGISRLDEHGSWRLRPKTLQLHAYRRTSGGGNPWGMAFGTWGEPFIKSNGPGISELLPSLVQVGYTASYWGGEMKIGQTRIKSMILEWAESPHLPEAIHGDLLVAGYFAHVIDRFKWDVDGSGHRLENMPPLIRSSHRAFRPVDIRIGPDGAIYIADWFNPIIGHYQASLRHPDRDKTHGRVWRVTATGRPLAKAPVLSTLDAPGLCRHLASSWRYVRYQAKRCLADLPAGEVIPALSTWIDQLDAEDPDLEHHLFEALGVFESQEVINRPLLERLLQAKDYRARAYATRVVGRWGDRLEAPLRLLDQCIVDEHPRVRLEAIVACSDIRSAESMVVAAKASSQPLDRFARYALTKTSHALAPHWRPALAKGGIHFEQPEHLGFVLRAYGGKDVVAAVRALLESPEAAPGISAGLMVLLVEIGTPGDLRWVLDRAADEPTVLDALIQAARVRGLKPDGDLVASLTQLLGNGNQAIRTRAIRLAGDWKIEALTERVRQIFANGQAPVAARAFALEALGSLEGRKALDGVLATVNDPAPGLRRSALRTLCELDLPLAAKTANRLLRKAVDDEGVHAIVLPFLGHKEGPASLAIELASAPVPPGLATRIRSALGAAGRFDAALDKVLRSSTDRHAVGLPAYSASYVEALSTEVRNSGNPAKGAKVYASAGLSCVACHKLGQEGGVLGPELSAVGAGVPVELLIEAVLWPRRQIKEGYSATMLTTKAGRVIGGYVQREDKQQIVIRDAATGETQVVPVQQVAQRQDAGTLMPPGLTAGLLRSDLRDLIRFLADQKGSGPRP
jgi:putative heme-binding domain-containing protein